MCRVSRETAARPQVLMVRLGDPSMLNKVRRAIGIMQGVEEVRVRSASVLEKEDTLAKIDHAFGQLRMMQEGLLDGIDAEDLLHEL